jgi:Rieske Fe-S protein
MNTDNTATRRQFIKQFTLGTVVSTAAGQTLVQRALGEIPDEDTSGILTVKVSDYPVFNVTNGSIRINLSPIAGNGQPGRWYPVILTRGGTVGQPPNNTFYPLEGRCTHEECILRWYGWNNTTYIACHCHESRFRRTGTVQAGPATEALTVYPYTFDGTFVRITLPNFYHKVNVAPVPQAPGSRLRLDFNASRNVKHRLLHRPTLDAAWTQMSFSLTPTGPANQTQYTYSYYVDKQPETQAASLYVDFPGDRGFFAIAVETEVEHN